MSTLAQVHPGRHSPSGITPRLRSPKAASKAADVIGQIVAEDDARRLSLAERLHKDVAGGLVACTAVCEMIRYESADRGGSGPAAELLASLEGSLRQTIQFVRHLTEEQFPPALNAFGLGCALQQFVRKLSESSGGGSLVTISVRGDEPELHPRQRLNLFRLMQSLVLLGVGKPDISRVKLSCVYLPKKAEFLIDYAGGECLTNGGRDGLEIAVIRARAALLGGRLLVSRKTSPGSSNVRLVLPLPVS